MVRHLGDSLLPTHGSQNQVANASNTPCRNLVASSWRRLGLPRHPLRGHTSTPKVLLGSQEALESSLAETPSRWALDPEAAEQVRSRAGLRGTRPAKDEGPLDTGIRDPCWVLLEQCAPERANALRLGVFYPLPHRRSPISLSVLLRDGQKDERLPAKAVPARVALCRPSPGGGGLPEDTAPHPPLPFASLASPAQSTPA